MPLDHDAFRGAPRRKRRVVIDFFPVQPDGSNGGIKVMACELGPELFRQAPDIEFVILTGVHNHHALRYLEASNARCVRIDDPAFAGWPDFSRPYGVHGDDLHADIEIGFDGFLPEGNDLAGMSQILKFQRGDRFRSIGMAYDSAAYRAGREAAAREQSAAASTLPRRMQIHPSLSQGFDRDEFAAEGWPWGNTDDVADLEFYGQTQTRFPVDDGPVTTRSPLSRMKRALMERMPEPCKWALRNARSGVRHHWSLLPHYRFWAMYYTRAGARRGCAACMRTARRGYRKLRSALGLRHVAYSKARGLRFRATQRVRAGRVRFAEATARMRYRLISIERYERKCDRHENALMKKVRTRFEKFEADLVFAPFSWQGFCGQGTPSVTVIVDLQHRFFQDFFERGNWLARELQFRRTARNANRIVAISEWTRQTILDAMPELPASRVTAIHIGVAERLERPDDETIARQLQGLELTRDEFLLFPANFWPHKNHANAIAAFEMFVKRHPETRLKLALTGEDTGRGAVVKELIDAAGLSAHVVFTGYCSNTTLAALMASCRALYFPSLFEGFGIPPVEAMAMGRPVLCSNVASLPEIVGDAAILFDPTRPAEICAAIERLQSGEIDLETLRQRGIRRVNTIGDVSLMAARYLTVIREVLAETTPATQHSTPATPAIGTRQAA